MPSYKSGSWRKYNLKRLCWCVKGEVEKLVQPGGCFEIIISGSNANQKGGGLWETGVVCFVETLL